MKPEGSWEAGRPPEEQRAWKRGTVMILVCMAALGAAFFLHSPYMAFAVYAFLLLVMAAHGTSYIWLAGLDCERTTDRIQVWVDSGDTLNQALAAHETLVKSVVLADGMTLGQAPADAFTQSWDINGEQAVLAVRKV